jgi:molybdopterin synthase sulfur carrier subunit
MRMAYFSWIRERIGAPGEDIDIPADVATVGELLAWLKRRGDNYAAALAHEDIVRVAIDRVHVGDRTAAIAGAGEIALFPPMTGG